MDIRIQTRSYNDYDAAHERKQYSPMCGYGSDPERGMDCPGRRKTLGSWRGGKTRYPPALPTRPGEERTREKHQEQPSKTRLHSEDSILRGRQSLLRTPISPSTGPRHRVDEPAAATASEKNPILTEASEASKAYRSNGSTAEL